MTKADVHFKIRAQMSCDTLNCIYVLKCEGCSKLYIGETNNLRLRVNLHKSHANINCGLNVSRHFYNCNPDGGNKFLVMPFYKLSMDDANFRKRMETHFIKKLKPELNSIL